jgi:hypothetical protein
MKTSEKRDIVELVYYLATSTHKLKIETGSRYDPAFFSKGLQRLENFPKFRQQPGRENERLVKKLENA